ncbi:MAG TPA: methyltransferase [Candidatus Obscuribacterales bacterium]
MSHKKADSPAAKNRKAHNELQREYFNQKADIFLQPIPPEVRKRTREIVNSARLDSSSTVLDVGTGTGALIEHFLEDGVKQENIVGCDLSDEMIERAKKRFPGVAYWRGDILEFPSLPAPSLPPQIKDFNAVFFNACFGNIFDRQAAVARAQKLLKPGGRVIISHPLGLRFQRSLHESGPDIVPHLLPAKKELEAWSRELTLVLETFRDEKDFYLAALKKSV